MSTDYRRFFVHLNRESDADVIAYLEAQANTTDAIRRAIRREIKEAR